VAIVGYGLAGRVFHGPLISATDGLVVDAIITADPQRQAQAIADHPQARVLGAVADVWAGGRPDLLVVASPNDVHAEITQAAIEHGVGVVVDKPLAVSCAEGADLVRRAREAGVLLTVFQNRRWDSDMLTLLRLRQQGRLGEIRRFESRFERWRPQARPDAWRERESPHRGGGILLDLGSHLVDQALHLFGPATHVYGEVGTERGLPGDDDAFIILRHRSQVISHLHGSAVTPAPGPRLRVLGSRAALLITGLDSQEDALRAGHDPREHGWGREPGGEAWLIAGDERHEVQREPGAWPRFYRELQAALRDGAPPPVDPEDAVRTLQVLELARASAAQRAVLAVGD
jgi:predicted dehydrogenase